MVHRSEHSNAAPLFAVAALIYTANCALGAAVAARLVDTSRFRWVHHALYVGTCATVAVSLSAAWWATPKRSTRRAVLALLPAVVPLAGISRVPTHSARHPLVALSAAPFIAAGLVSSHRSSDGS